MIFDFLISLQEDGNLHLLSVNQDMQGEYTCRAETSIDADMVSAIITVSGNVYRWLLLSLSELVDRIVSWYEISLHHQLFNKSVVQVRMSFDHSLGLWSKKGNQQNWKALNKFTLCLLIPTVNWWMQLMRATCIFMTIECESIHCYRWESTFLCNKI